MADYYYNWVAGAALKAARLNDLFDGATTPGALLCRTSGTKTNAAYSFNGDADTGIYRIGADNLGLTCGDTKIIDLTTTGASIVGTLAVSGACTITGLTASGAVTLGSTVTIYNTGYISLTDVGSTPRGKLSLSSSVTVLENVSGILRLTSTHADAPLQKIELLAGASTIATVSSTGLAVNGNASISGPVTLGSSVTIYNTGYISLTDVGSTPRGKLSLSSSATVLENVSGILRLTSTHTDAPFQKIELLAGASTIATVSSTGLAVTGVVSGTSFTVGASAGVSGTITNQKTATVVNGIITNIV